MIHFLCAVLLAAGAASAAVAQPDPATLATEAAAEFGPAVGARAPLLDARLLDGSTPTLAELSGPRGVVVYFNRSLDWCPICIAQTLELQAAEERFNAAGWAVAVLTYDSAEALARGVDRRGITLTVLSDPDSETIDAWGVRDPIYQNPEHMAYGVPYPIAFAIRPDGVVAAKFWHEGGLGADRGYAVRVSADDVLAALR
ncbi:MAG: peroxiredoxin family protein [Oceanicaulis sp.]